MAKRVPDFQDKTLSLLDGALDLRSPPGEANPGDFRIVLNLSVDEFGRFARMGGWKSLSRDSEFGFKNQDLHDQLIGCQFYYDSLSRSFDELNYTSGLGYPYWFPGDPGYAYGTPFNIIAHRDAYVLDYCGDTLRYQGGCREPITMLYEASSSLGRRCLLAGTTSRIYALNDVTGNWKILADRLGGTYDVDNNCGCGNTRFKAAQAGDYVAFTNGRDPVMMWAMGMGPHGCDVWSADYSQELLVLNITSADCIASWRGFLFIGDVVREGQRRTGEIFWSDFNNPLSWYPGSESSAGFVDLGQGERIVAIEPLGGQLRVYTTRGAERAIYEVALIGGDEVFNFREIYRGPDGLEYKNSIINTGETHIYLSEHDVFVLAEFDRTPRKFEWLHKAGGAFFNGIPAQYLKEYSGLAAKSPVNKAMCDQVIGFYDAARKAAWFSWPTGSNECPDLSMVLYLDFHKASIVDHGFTAGINHRPDYYTSLRDWIVELNLCDPAAFLVAKEGEPYDMTFELDPPSYIHNQWEDGDLDADLDSVCARVAGTDLFDYCKRCESPTVMVLADASDFTLKEYTPDECVREVFTGPVLPDDYDCPETYPGSYVDAGYDSMWQIEVLNFDIKVEKLINAIVITYEAAAQTTPNDLNLQVAYGAQPSCMLWRTGGTKELECLTESSDQEHADAGTRHSRQASFPLFRQGVYLAWRFYIEGTGGGASFGDVTMRVKPAQGNWR